MKTIFDEWAEDWGVSQSAVADLQRRTVNELATPINRDGLLEHSVQNRIRVEGAQFGALLMRNNVGAYKTEDGGFVRYGLANESKEMNRQSKSSDLVGVRKRLIKQHHVGTVIGQFTLRECKREGWKYTGTDAEKAQLNFIRLMQSYGADACFASGKGTFQNG